MTEKKGAGVNISDSVVDAFKPSKIAFRIVAILFFGLFLIGPKNIVHRIDLNSVQGGNFLTAIWQLILAEKDGIWMGFKTVGQFFVDLFTANTYIPNQSWGTILITLFVFGGLVAVFYQMVSVGMDALDKKRGHATGRLMRIVVSIVIIFIISVTAFTLSDKQTIATNPWEINNPENVTKSAINITDSDFETDPTLEIPTLDLLNENEGDTNETNS